MKLGHLLTHSGLMYPEASSKVCHDYLHDKSTNKRMWLNIFKNVNFWLIIQACNKLSSLISSPPFPPDFLLKHCNFSHWLASHCKPQPLLIGDTYILSYSLLLTHPEKRGDCSICQKNWRTSTNDNTGFYKLKTYNQKNCNKMKFSSLETKILVIWDFMLCQEE
jgi:hypothetical protein